MKFNNTPKNEKDVKNKKSLVASQDKDFERDSTAGWSDNDDENFVSTKGTRKKAKKTLAKILGRKGRTESHMKALQEAKGE